MTRPWLENWKKKFTHGPNVAAMPDTLPGRFVVIVYRKDEERATIHLDDDDRSSYDLGSNIPLMLNQFRWWNKEKLLEDIYNLAREFGAAQGIFESNRTVVLHDEKAKPVSVFNEDRKPTLYMPTLKG